MLLLLHSAHATILREHWPHPNLGRLLSPRQYSRAHDTAEVGIPWAADNDAYSAWDAGLYAKMLDALKWIPGCLFVTAPDVVADVAATDALFAEWEPAIAWRGLPVGYVLQDGCERPPWERLDALFIGGSTTYKMGEVAEAFVTEARQRGKWVHMGRVNTAPRFRYARAVGCDSVDGSQFSRWRGTWLAEGLGLAAAPSHLRFSF